MRSFQCQCGATLFFGSRHCVACGSETAMCPECRHVAALQSSEDGTMVCRNCERTLRHCCNSSEFQVCNNAVLADDRQRLCRYCRTNEVIPDLNVDGNLEKWGRLEAAKHRVLYDVERIGLPLTIDDSHLGLPLRFEFKSSDNEPVSTGHADGLITIDTAEADSVQREQNRVQFGEPQRTLVGHFRHELGHYFWQSLVEPEKLDEFRAVFGDERNPAYVDARQRYYAQGADVNWQDNYISAYATMHPWEDFAETFAAYMDMNAIIATARHFERINVEATEEDFNQMCQDYADVGIVANEFNRDLGLLDLVPEVFTDPVIEKLRFIHKLR